RLLRRAHAAAAHAQPLERLRARHLVHEVAVDVEEAGAVGLPVDDVIVKNLVVKRLGHWFGLERRGIFPSDSVSRAGLQISRPCTAHKPRRAAFWTASPDPQPSALTRRAVPLDHLPSTGRVALRAAGVERGVGVKDLEYRLIAATQARPPPPLTPPPRQGEGNCSRLG